MIQFQAQETKSDTSNSDIPARAMYFIRSRRVIRLSELASSMGLDGHTVWACTQAAVRNGEIECMAPAWLDLHSTTGLSERAMELIYYRWVEQSDRDYIWQKHIIRPARHVPCRTGHPPPFEQSRRTRRRSRRPAGAFQVLRSLLLLYLS